MDDDADDNGAASAASAAPVAAPRKRPWLQFHLSTAVVLMFVAAGLLWANTRPRLALTEIPWQDDEHTMVHVERVRGWPTPYLKRWLSNDSSPIEEYTEEVQRRTLQFSLEEDRWENVRPAGAVLDVLVAAAILATVAVLCECLIRRKDRRP